MTAPDVAARKPARDAAVVTAWNLASRVTGFARVVVVAGALGATRLGDTFQAANQVSNLLFEFLAAGTLSAILVPGLVSRLAADRADDARAFAGAVLGRVLCVLVPVALVGIVLAKPIMRVVFSANDTSTYAAQVRLGTFLLFFVLPQLLLYAWGAVVTAMLHAAGRFAAAAFAPVANNVVVTLALAVFWWRGATGLALGAPDKWLLGLAVLFGVGAMTVVPAVAAVRAGLPIRPTLRREPSLALRDVGWATLVLLPPQLYLLGSLVVAGRVTGGVVACQVGFTLFLLPHALFGHPLATVLYPRIAADAARADIVAASLTATDGFTNLLRLTAGPAALLVALAPWAVRALAVGALDKGAGPSLVAAALAGYAVGLPAYSLTLFATRVSYAHGDTRTPAVAALGGGAVGAIVLIGVGGSDANVVRWIGAGHSLLALTTVVGIAVVLVRRSFTRVDAWSWLGAAGCALAAGVAARACAGLVHGSSRAASFGAVMFGGVVGAVVYVAGLYASGVRRVPASVGP